MGGSSFTSSFHTAQPRKVATFHCPICKHHLTYQSLHDELIQGGTVSVADCTHVWWDLSKVTDLIGAHPPLSLYLSLHLNCHFPRRTWVSQYQNVSPFWIYWSKG